jgi:hypothetical protein
MSPVVSSNSLQTIANYRKTPDIDSVLSLA